MLGHCEHGKIHCPKCNRASMTPKQRKIARCAKLVAEAADLADKYELTLGNGAQVGSLLSGIAGELASQAYEVA